MIRFAKGCFALWIALLFAIAGCSGAGENNTSLLVSGKVIQSYVANATVCVDENGNRVCDPGEPSTKTAADGSFTLQIPDNAGGLLCVTGGIVASTNATALPLLAPPTAKNITPLTTLVALDPDVKAAISAAGIPYDTDIANPNGVKGRALKLALVVESVMYNLKNQMGLSASKQISVMSVVAHKLASVNIGQDTEIISAVNEGLKKAFNSTSTISSVNSTITAICNNIGDNVVKEQDVLPQLSNVVYNSMGIAFDPGHEIIPVPNDLIWANTNKEVQLNATAVEDPSTKELYEAINMLHLKGLSPNSIIAIPLSNSTELNATTLKNNIFLIKADNLGGAVYQALNAIGVPPQNATLSGILPVLVGLNATQLAQLQNNLNLENVDDDTIKVVQDGNYIKIFPLEPLDLGKQYVVVVKSGITLAGTNSTLVGSPVFDLLKSTSKIENEDLKALEPVREAYAPLFTLLSAYGISRNDVLELFTFYTASKTLTLQEFGYIKAALANNQDLQDFLTANNVSINGTGNFTSEYYSINSAISLLKGNSVVNATHFVSFDITTLGPNPSPIWVPYKIFNATAYNGTVIVFQHGLGGSKNDALALATNIPNVTIISMDLPEHGARSTNATSGANYLTANIGQDRINFYQSYFDIAMFLTDLKDGKFDLNGDGTPDTPTNIYFVGLSLGSITGSVATSLNSNLINKIVLNVGGANFAALIDQAKNAGIRSMLDALGITPNTTEYFVTMDLMQLLLDPADPSVLVEGDNIKAKTMLQNMYMDTVVPNVSNEALAVAVGYNPDTYQVYSPDNLPLNAAAGYPATYNNWFMFKGSGDNNWLPHAVLMSPSVQYPNGTLVYPEADGHITASNANWANWAVNKFIKNFLNLN